ncbi:salivary endonuclease-like [Arctopsyche grandis]|uniref:salivary endonuclease-like n=1 Tax=Arctopsyche grandis TaxID=121162 RepID=UPI00406D9A51
MDSKTVLVLLAVLIWKTCGISAQGCLWNLNTDLPVKDPIYLKSSSNANFLIPNNASGLSLAINENVVLACPGKSNTINGTGLQELTATCTTNNELLFSNKMYKLNALECSNTTSSDLEYSKVSCAGGRGEIFKIGFKTSKGTAYLIDVCYDKVNEASFYAINTIYGKAINGAEIESDRPSFRTLGLTNGTTTANMYKQTEELKSFTILLGLKQAEKYITDASYLARGHLAPDADFLFGSWSFATYFLVNAAPEWQVVNAGNWLRVENLARDVAAQRQEDLQIITGTHSVLQLPNESGTMVDIYLMTPNKLRVPKWYWKIIYSPATKEGIALVTLNNPHVTSINVGEMFCKNICLETNWSRAEWANFSKGFTFCCGVNDLISAVGTLSPMIVTGNMTGPTV